MRDQKVLIGFDPVLLAMIERERAVQEETQGKRPPRTKMVRILIMEALQVRRSGRGEPMVTAVPVEETDQGESEDENTTVEGESGEGGVQRN